MLKAEDVKSLMVSKENEIVEAVREAYEAHSLGQSSLPHSTFLRFKDKPRNRIIAMPSYLGGDGQVAGVKWIASFPDNVERAMERASAVLVLNSTSTGRSEALREASQIRAMRTAASAALAARSLAVRGETACLGLVGCGVINFEVLRFLRVLLGSPARLKVFDSKTANAASFLDKCASMLNGVEQEVATNLEEIAAECDLARKERIGTRLRNFFLVTSPLFTLKYGTEALFPSYIGSY